MQMNSSEQTPTQLPLAALVRTGLLLGMFVGFLLSVVDPMIAMSRLSAGRLLRELPGLVPIVAVPLIPFFALTGGASGFILYALRQISHLFHRISVRLLLPAWTILVFTYLAHWRLRGEVGYKDCVKTGLLAFVAAVASYWILRAVTLRTVRSPNARRVWLALCSGLVLWGVFLGLVLADRAEQLRNPLAFGVSPPSDTRPSVLLVVLDTVRADHMSCYGYKRKTTPQIDAFATDARLYRNVLSPSCWTLPSHASFFTGLPSSAHGCTAAHQRLLERWDTLAERLSAAGYQTLGISANGFLSASRGFGQGFDIYSHDWPGGNFNTIGERLGSFLGLRTRDGCSRASMLNRRLADWFRRDYGSDKPFFIFLNYIEAHAPYLPPSHVLEWTTEETRRQMERIPDDGELRYGYMFRRGEGLSEKQLSDFADLYDEEIRYVDGKVGALLQFFRENKLDREALIIITSDHGEHLGEHAMMDHQYSLYEPLVRVPLIVRSPGRFEPGKDTRLVQSHDLFPTILEVCGVPFQAGPEHNSRSLLAAPTSEARLGVAEYLHPYLNSITRYFSHVPSMDVSLFLRRLRVVQKQNTKLILPSPGLPELYDLGADPFETRNLAEKQLETVQSLTSGLDAWLGSFSHYQPEEGDADFDLRVTPEELEALRALGYIS